MTLLIAGILALIGLTLAAQLYLRESTESHKAARRVWDALSAGASAVVEGDFPAPVREIATRLSMSTGCGCYVRSLLIEHYAPRFHSVRVSDASEKDDPSQFREAMRGMSPQQKRTFDELVGSAIAFDIMVNPIQGWFARRLLKKHFALNSRSGPLPSPSKRDREAVIRTATKKASPELCAV